MGLLVTLYMAYDHGYNNLATVAAMLLFKKNISYKNI